MEKKKTNLCPALVLPVECLSTHGVVLCCVETDFMTAVNSGDLGMHFKPSCEVDTIFNKRVLNGIWEKQTLFWDAFFLSVEMETEDE